MMNYSHSSQDDIRLNLTATMVDRATGHDVYAMTGERSQLAKSILRLPMLERAVLTREIDKLDRMKQRYENRMKKVANSFLCSQTTKAVQWQHADIHWASSTATKMPCFRNNSFVRSKTEIIETEREQEKEKERQRRRDSSGVLYKSADYSSFGDRNYYRLMRGNSNITKPPPIAGLASGPRLEFLRYGGQMVFNKVTHVTTKDVVENYSEALKNRNHLLSRASITR